MLIIAGIGLFGCATKEPSQDVGTSVDSEEVVSVNDAVQIANRYLDQQQISYENTRTNVKLVDDSWWIFFYDRTPKPGGDFIVRVTREGKVTDILPGE
jgi:hypothetical protein